MVILSHTVERLVHPVFASLGYLGVTMFFALSGYLITCHLLDEYESLGVISIDQFYIRRLFRILPAALFYLAVVGILARSGIVKCDWTALKAAIFFFANYREDYDRVGWMIGHFWSLSVEEHFYLIWPMTLVFFGVLNGCRTASVLALLIAFMRIVDDRYHFLAWMFHDPSVTAFHSDLVADVILWGCCLAFYLRRNPHRAGGRWLWTGITSVTFFMLLAPSIFNIPHVAIPAHILPALILGSVLSSPDAPIGRFLKLPPLRYIGKLSYSLYLWQTLFLSGPEPHIKLPMALAAIFGCAFLSFTFIEQPFIRMGRELIDRRTRLVAQAGV